ncbi:MAG: RluA family pseudouridine synthase [Firmicutes bacterium]|jgi:23S rRNA pseudouridine1911/1915/1917 synthase|nr:RluA family pseudouridine synthase [Bacillota bacterium]
MEQQGRVIQLMVEEQEAGIRLDRYLTEKIEGRSRSFLRRLIDQGSVLVNGRQVKAGYSITAGDAVLVQIPAPEPLEVAPEPIPLDILYEDRDIIVINKPPGMVVHPAAGNYQGTLVNALLAHCRDLSGIGGKLRPGIVHRLDKDTSGVLVAVKNDYAHKSLAAQLKLRTVQRWYLALAKGNFSEDQGVIDAPIGRHPVKRKQMAVVGKGRPARTWYWVRERFEQSALVECRLETGRTHQIRVHLAHIHHPLVGDQVYGGKQNHLGMTRQALHAYHLGFDHPRTGEPLTFSAPLPHDMAEVVEKLRRQRVR